MERSDKVKPGESKFGILREPLTNVAAGAVVKVSRGRYKSLEDEFFSYEIDIPGVRTYRGLTKSTVESLVEILE